LFTRPANVFVAGFIGSPAMNLLAGAAAGDHARAGSLSVALTPDQLAAATSSAVTIGVRPESWRLAAEGGLDARVDLVEELGSESYLYCTAVGVDGQSVVARAEGLSSTRPGDTVSLVPKPDAVHLFDTATGRRLPDRR
jgi:multiple sugar transport system ATP-binding protein